MVRPDPVRLQAALAVLYTRAMTDHRLAAEVHQARREYFGPDNSTEPDGLETLTPRETRFREWFLLERESIAVGTTPHDVLGVNNESEALDGSLAGAFRIVQEGADPLLANDLQDDAAESFEVEAPPGTLQKGDLLVGRIYPGAEGRWMPSVAVAVYRPGGAIATALQRDLVHLALDRRLSQAELEHLLLRKHQGLAAVNAADAVRPVEHLEAALQKLLIDAGDRYEITEVSEALQSSARPGPVVGPLLDELAFESNVDLEEARRVLLELWNAHHQSGEPLGSARVLDVHSQPQPQRPDQDAVPEVTGSPSGETLGQRLVRALDAGLAAHEDVEELFAKLEAMAGIESSEDEADEAGVDPMVLVEEVAGTAQRTGEDFGDLEPLVQEYLWETGRGDTDDARALQLFVELQQNAPLPRTDLEHITGEDLMRILLHVYLHSSVTERSDAVRGTFDVLQRFYKWAQETQELPLQEALDGCRGALLDHLDRLQVLCTVLSTREPDPAARPPALLQVEDLGEDGFGVRSDEGHHWVPASEEVLENLSEGDLLLGAMSSADDGAEAALSGLVVALPADAQSLMT